MKLNFLLCLATGFVLATLDSCVPTKTLVDTSCAGYKSNDFKRSDISVGGIGLMPVLGGGEKEQFRRPMGDAIYKYLKLEFGENNVKSTNDVITIINNENLSDNYTQAINDYRISGIVPKNLVNQLGSALNVNYLLYTRLLADSEIEFTTIGTTLHSYNIDEIYVQCQIWDTRKGDIAWEGKGGVAKLAQNSDDLIEKTAAGLSKVIGNEINNGPCEDKKTLLRYAQEAYTNTYLAVIGVSM